MAISSVLSCHAIDFKVSESPNASGVLDGSLKSQHSVSLNQFPF